MTGLRLRIPRSPLVALSVAFVYLFTVAVWVVMWWPMQRRWPVEFGIACAFGALAIGLFFWAAIRRRA